MALLRRLARAANMVVHVDPGPEPGTSLGRFHRLPGQAEDLPELVLTGAARNLNRLTLELDALSPVLARAGQLDPASLSVLTAEVAAIGLETLGETPATDFAEPKTVFVDHVEAAQPALEAAAQAAVDRGAWAFSAEGEVSAEIYPGRARSLPHHRPRRRRQPAVGPLPGQRGQPRAQRRALHPALHAAPQRPLGHGRRRAHGGVLMRGLSFERLVAGFIEDAQGRFFGKFAGLVADVDDPEGLGRLRATVPELFGAETSAWALPCAPYAGPDQGFFAVPPVGAAVWIEFQAGDVSRPIWCGGWWPRGDAPKPEEGGQGAQATKVLKTGSGLNIALDDDGEAAVISDGAGANKITLTSRNGRIVIEATGKVVVDAPQIELVSGAPHPLVFGDNLLSYLNQLVATFNAHTHRRRDRARRARQSRAAGSAADATHARAALDAGQDRIGDGSWRSLRSRQVWSATSPIRSRATWTRPWSRNGTGSRTSPCPTTRRSIKDRQLLFVAIARGMLGYLERREDRIGTTEESAFGTGDHSHQLALRVGVTRMSGRHLRFPFRIGQDGRPESPADLADHVRGEVIQLLLTAPGERDFLPGFGGGLKRLVFEANDDVTAALARARVTKALNFWLGARIEVKLLEASADGSTLSVELVYQLRGTEQTRRLRFEHDLRTLGEG